MNWYKKISMKVMSPREFLDRLSDYGIIITPAKKGVMLTNPANGRISNFHQEAQRKDLRRGVQSRILSNNLDINSDEFMSLRSKKKKQKLAPIQEIERPKKEKVPSWQLEPWYIEQQKMMGDTAVASSKNWFKRAKKGIPGGLADKKKPSDFDSKELEMGVKVELEHTSDKQLSKDIAMDHLEEFPGYYTELNKMEKRLDRKK